MPLQGLTKEVIATLNEIALDNLYGKEVLLPSKADAVQAMQYINHVFSNINYSHIDYAVRVLLMLDYAKSHVNTNGTTMLEDIKNGVRIIFDDYK